ncbi:hypothetical protein KP509_04G032400 [Ceratopteris richardii]|nr:hypothetical protein KP509_04G032400 [Ceratopteris richardii]
MHRVLPVHDDWGRRNEMKDHSNGMQKYGRIVSSSKKRSTPEDQSRGFPIFHENRKGFHGTVCCKGVAALLADCVALSCCPCAVLHLLALICVRLPIAVAQKLIVNTKDMIFSKRHPRNGRRDINLGCDLRKSWSNENSPDRYASINAKTTTGSFDIDMQNFWQAFEAGRLEFGRLSVRKDPEK